MNSVRLPANMLENVQVRNKRICFCGCYRNFEFHVLNGNEAEIVGFRGKKHLGFTRIVIVTICTFTKTLQILKLRTAPIDRFHCHATKK